MNYLEDKIINNDYMYEFRHSKLTENGEFVDNNNLQKSVKSRKSEDTDTKAVTSKTEDDDINYINSLNNTSKVENNFNLIINNTLSKQILLSNLNYLNIKYVSDRVDKDKSSFKLKKKNSNKSVNSLSNTSKNNEDDSENIKQTKSELLKIKEMIIKDLNDKEKLIKNIAIQLSNNGKDKDRSSNLNIVTSNTNGMDIEV